MEENNQDHLSDLPLELGLHIGSFLLPADLSNLRATSTYQQIVSEKAFRHNCQQYLTLAKHKYKECLQFLEGSFKDDPFKKGRVQTLRTKHSRLELIFGIANLWR